MDLFRRARWAFAFVLVGALVGATNACGGLDLLEGHWAARALGDSAGERLRPRLDRTRCGEDGTLGRVGGRLQGNEPSGVCVSAGSV
jgi:hypothetical protein